MLGDLDALKKPRVEVMNKIDLLDGHARETAGGRDEVLVSARTGEGTEALLAAIDGALRSDPIVDAELRVPQHEGGVLAAVDAGMVVHERSYEGNLVRLKVSGPASLVGRLRAFRLREK